MHLAELTLSHCLQRSEFIPGVPAGMNQEDVERGSMAKSRKRTKKEMPSSQSQQAPSPSEAQEEQARKFGWIPLWGWILIFLVPLIFSEFMFYMADRVASMIIFPIAWIGFWLALMQRSGWAILKSKKEE
jgi:hypothetical protein